MSATIYPFIKDRVFGPDAVASMGKAFDQACAATASLGQPSLHHAMIAKRIIELAQVGERDPQALCQHALEALHFPFGRNSKSA